MSDLLMTLLSVASIWIVAVITPGPNFLLTLQTTLSHSRQHALYGVVGIAIGTALWGSAGFLGIALLFQAAPWLYVGVKVVGGGYLIYLGIRLLWSSYHPAPQQTSRTVTNGGRWAMLRIGLWTNLSNPKSALFVSSLFASTLSQTPSLGQGIATIAIMTTLSFSWYALVALLFSTPRITQLYQQAKQRIDRMAGVLFIGFGSLLASQR
uniref:Threonine efflux protein n=1 Tax=Magnetococcus massalia (strain MO-1) TaxID=451514 RepID=A0A1S7LGU9_MAGMO|nr:Threonine efflux protein [Candidatus Magnetococcus massalia]